MVRSANGCGKDWLAARLALWWVYARQGLVLLTGPTERQVVEIVMGEVARVRSVRGKTCPASCTEPPLDSDVSSEPESSLLRARSPPG